MIHIRTHVYSVFVFYGQEGGWRGFLACPEMPRHVFMYFLKIIGLFAVVICTPSPLVQVSWHSQVYTFFQSTCTCTCTYMYCVHGSIFTCTCSSVSWHVWTSSLINMITFHQACCLHTSIYRTYMLEQKPPSNERWLLLIAIATFS